MQIRISRSQRLLAVIGIATCFFLGEISVGFYTHSIALVADAFHYLNDLVGFIVAYAAAKVSETEGSPKSLTFGWQRAQLLGAFFNGALLLALGISVFLQSIERFISLQHVDNPKLVFIMGGIGLCLNVLSILFLHEHHHGHDHSGHSHGSHAAGDIPVSPVDSEIEKDPKHLDHRHSHQTARPSPNGHDLGMMGVLLHVLGDAANNIGVMVAALVMWLAEYEGRWYADPGTSMGIGMMIMLTSFPLVRSAGTILLESAPKGIDADDVKHDLERIPGVLSTHELHIWSLNQQKILASVHVTIAEHSMSEFLILARTINECFHAYGIHSITLQPEIEPAMGLSSITKEQASVEVQNLRQRSVEKCKVACGSSCEDLKCCG